MSNKYLTGIKKHREDFFLNNGQEIAETSSKIYQSKYPTKYSSSPPNNNDFPSKDIFTFIENTLSEKLNSDYKVHLDADLIDYRINYYSRQEQLKMVQEVNYLDSIYYFNFFPTAIPLKIRELLNENLEILEEYYKTCIDSHLKKFYIRGHVNEFWLNVDYLYKFGFNKYINQLNRFGVTKIQEIDADLNN